ncbi:MAG: type VI-D CRISPR-associated RNA-guided ribonuclease Cas13d [Clostridiales bacterium]|nr:type VI-D CRISPR-associated RNA-guided ribonuclease Cas13d [Clostridiales bacterium]
MNERVKDNKGKSIAKANGLKSTFKIRENEFLMTSFGKGNEAQEEKYITGGNVENCRNTFTATVKNDKQTSVYGVTKIATDVQLPVEDNNLLQAKSTIEKIFFEKSYEDNIHVQIAYQIFDIKKLFSIYANSIVCAIDNICDKAETEDWLGSFYTGNSYRKARAAYLIKNKITDWNHPNYYNSTIRVIKEEWNKYNCELKFISAAVNKSNFPGSFMAKLGNYLYENYKAKENNVNRLADSYKSFDILLNKLKHKAYYFDGAFFNNEGEFDDERAFALLRLCSIMRQSAAHEKKDTKAWFYNIEADDDVDFLETINKIVSTKVDSINNNFINQNKVNLSILFNIYNRESEVEIAKRYYDFIVRKSYKNIGFSLKQLRETMLSLDKFSFITEDKYNSVRSKLYSLIDFVIYNYYIDNPEKIDTIVGSLRCTQNDDDKIKIYIENAEFAAKELGDTILKQIVPSVDESNIKKLSKEGVSINFDELSGYMENISNISFFSKAIYCISLMLDGKEINMFLNSLIEKFGNIASFNKTLEERSIENKYNANYKLFEKSGQIAKELTFLKSIAKMSKSKKAVKDSSKIKRIQYLDAAYLLDEYNDETINNLFGMSNKPNRGSAISNIQKNNKQDNTRLHSLRNFIINNVINSNKFHYIVRFINPKDAKKIMTNEILVKLALREINVNQRSQIERYCKTIEIAYNERTFENDLWDKLKNISLSSFLNVNNAKESVEKEKSKALLGLYMTILYYIVKKLVRINVSYFIALGTLERDEYILNSNFKENNSECCFDVKSKSDTYDPCAISVYFKEQGLLNSRTKNFFAAVDKKSDENISSSTIDYTDKSGKRPFKKSNSMAFYEEDKNGKWIYRQLFRSFRNNVEHITAVRSVAKYSEKITSHRINDFFDIYHYLMYCCIDDSLNDRNEPFMRFKRSHPMIDEYQTVCKQLLYILCLPFAYNSARFYNLTVKEKFLASYGK